MTAIALALTFVVPLAPLSGSMQQQSLVVETARAIAQATEQQLQAQEPAQRAELRATIDRLTGRLRTTPNARSELESVLAGTASYLTMSAAAYALYLVDTSRVNIAVDALLRQSDRVMFANQPLAQRLILVIGAPAVPALVRHADNAMVVHLLGSMGPAAAAGVPSLVARLGTNNVEVAAALVRIGTPQATAAARPVLQNVLRDPLGPDAKAASIAAGGLGSAGGDLSPLLRNAAIRGTPDTRLYAAIALAAVGDTASSSGALAVLVRDKELHGRYAALRQLGALGVQARAAVPALIQVLLDDTDKRYGDRALAAEALLKIDSGNPDVRAALAKAATNAELRLHLERQGVVPP